MAQISRQDKRLQALKQQLYGKEKVTPYKIEKLSTSKAADKDSSKNLFSVASAPTTVGTTSTSETIFLKNDLFKILILSLLAVGVEIVLFFAQQNHLIKI